MHCTCVRHTDLPHTTRCSRTCCTIPTAPRTFIATRFAIWTLFARPRRKSDLPTSERAALVAALRGAESRRPVPGTSGAAGNGGGSDRASRWACFPGRPIPFTRRCTPPGWRQWLTANGIPAVPVFWLATEDHDFAEVNHVWVFDATIIRVKLEMRRSASAQPVGDVTSGRPSGERIARRAARAAVRRRSRRPGGRVPTAAAAPWVTRSAN